MGLACLLAGVSDILHLTSARSNGEQPLSCFSINTGVNLHNTRGKNIPKWDSCLPKIQLQGEYYAHLRHVKRLLTTLLYQKHRW